MANSELHLCLPLSIQEDLHKLQSFNALATKNLCPNSTKMLKSISNDYEHLCNCSECNTALELNKFRGDLLDIDEDTFILLHEETKEQVIQNFDSLPSTAYKFYLEGEIEREKGNLVDAANAYKKAIFGGVFPALIQYGSVLVEQAKNEKEKKLEKTFELEANCAFLCYSYYSSFGKLQLSRQLLKDSQFTLCSISREHKVLVDNAIIDYVEQNKTSLTTLLKDLIDEQYEHVCVHNWEKFPEQVPNHLHPDSYFTKFCVLCGLNM